MKRLKLFLGFSLLLLFSATFFGCYEGYGEITSASPNPDEITYLEPGEEIEFSVNVNASPDHRIRWYVKVDINNPDNISDTFKFTYNLEKYSDKVNVYCVLETLDTWFGWGYDTGSFSFRFGFHTEWLLKDSLEWEIRLLQKPPTWYGDYIIENNTDIQALNGYTEITGDLKIIRSDLTNLESFNALTSIGGLYIYENDSLTSLAGLNDNITSLVCGLRIMWNRFLTNLDGLENITSIGGDISIDRNIALINLDGLSNITSISGNLTIEFNRALTSLDGLSSELTSIGGSLSIDCNYTLTSLVGLSNITSIGGSLAIEDNYALTSLDGLSNISSIGYALVIGYNYALTSLSGLSSELTSIGGGLSIGGNDALTSLVGLSNITSIGSSLSIYDNNALASLSGLSSELTSIGGGLSIGGNDALTSLSGLDNIISVDYLKLSENAVLTSLEGLNSLCSVEGKKLYSNYSILIDDNDELCTNLAEALREQILSCDPDGVEGEIVISDNKICP